MEKVGVRNAFSVLSRKDSPQWILEGGMVMAAYQKVKAKEENVINDLYPIN